MMLVWPYWSCVCNQQTPAQSDSDSSDDEDIYSDVYEILSSNNSKVMLLPDHQPIAASEASSSPSRVERRQHTAAASARSRMSIICMDNDSVVHRPSVVSSRRRPTVKKYAIDDFNFVKVLGKGSFGKVHPSVLTYLCTCSAIIQENFDVTNSLPMLPESVVVGRMFASV